MIKVILSKTKYLIPLLTLLGVSVQVQAMESSGHSRFIGNTDRLIVKYRTTSAFQTNTRRAQSMLNSAGRSTGTFVSFIRNTKSGAQVWRLNGRRSAATLQTLTANIARNPDVEYVEPDFLMLPMFTPNDSRYNEQWHYFEATGGLNLPTAWDNSTGQGAVVAVLDTGYRPHADLVANILPGYDMISSSVIGNDGNGRDADARDPGDATAANECGFGTPARNSSWHGTHVAGTISAITNNGTGVAGVAFDARVLPVRVLGKCGGFTSDIADGVIWAAGGSVPGVPANPNPANVINLSLGGAGPCSATMQNAINQARALNTTVVVAAGNARTNVSNASPANCNGVVAVAATDRTGGRAFYSNFGNLIDISAPGGDTRTGTGDGVLSTLNTGATSPGNDSFAFYQGTSMAAPHVSGLAALLYSADSTLTPNQVEATLTSTARAFPVPCNSCGAGIADATAAVNAVLGGPAPAPVPVPVPDPTPTPAPAPVTLTNGVPVAGLTGAQDDELHFTLAVPAGATNLQFRMSGGTGNADIYVRFGATPTTTVFDFRPNLNGNTETVNVTTAQTGTYYVMVQGAQSFSGVNLIASFTQAAQCNRRRGCGGRGHR